MMSVHVLGLKLLFLLILSHWTRLSLAKNASVAYSPLTRGEQQVLGWTGGYEEDVSVDTDYLKLSLKRELQKRLSPDAWIVLEGEEGFAALDARYTDYKRPRHIAAVQVAEEKDVIETVNYARSRGIQFAARSGGHSLTTSHRRIQNAIAIDMRKLDSIKYSEQKQQMTVGGGITTGKFANATFAKGMEVSKLDPFHVRSRSQNQATAAAFQYSSSMGLADYLKLLDPVRVLAFLEFRSVRELVAFKESMVT
ncbi:MAG: hypothetical protein Q9157_000741 [Trypethelium eluteriae]